MCHLLIHPFSAFLATVDVMVEMLELAYLTNVLQLLRQRSHNLEQMFLDSRRRYEDEPIRRSFYNRDDPTTSRPENPRYGEDETFRFVQAMRPPSLRLSSRRQPQFEEREESNSRSTDPLDFSHFMDDVYRMFPR